MPVNPETTVRKNIAIPRELWEKVDDFRFAKRFGSESKAVVHLIELGIAAEPYLQAMLAMLDRPPYAHEPDQAKQIAALRRLLRMPD